MANKMPVLYIDLDNVVFDTICTIKQMYDEDFRYYPEYEWIPAHKIKHYDFSDLRYMTQERLMNYFRSGRFFDNLQYMEGAESTIAFLNQMQDCPVVFVSIGTPENLRGKEEWVRTFNHLWKTDAEFIGVDKIDKSHIDMSDGILIDDEIKNLEGCNAQKNICFGDYEWNQSWSGLRVLNWEEITKEVIGDDKGKSKIKLG